MISKRFAPSAALLLATILGAASANAGPYADEMGKCLVKSTTTEEKALLVKWIFSVAALHPNVSSVSSVTGEQRTELAKGVASMFEALLTKTCKTQTMEALRYEGSSTIQTSFGVLGQAAMMELFSNPAVRDGIGEFAKYVDGKKLQDALGIKQPQP